MDVKTNKQLLQEWATVVDAGDGIQNSEVKNTIARVTENTANERGYTASDFTQLVEDGTQTGHIDSQDPILISMFRRTAPSLIAFDVVGVQPMRGPVGLIFAMKAYYGKKADGIEALGIDEPNKDFTGTYDTATGENLGSANEVDATVDGQAPVTQVAPWPEMEFGIEKISVTAETRKLKARYTRELAQDLRALHGLDADAELGNMMVSEIRAEMNREMVFEINDQAKVGAQTGTAVAGTYNLSADSDGRWSVEKYKELMTFINRESQVVARETRRGLANFIITTADVAAALQEASKLDTTFMTQGLSFDGVGVTYAGLLSGRFKLYIDSYATANYVTLGYRGATSYDAGIIWAPYTGLERLSANGEEDFQPRLGYQTRYGIAYNPFTPGTSGTNQYYRRFLVTNL